MTKLEPNMRNMSFTSNIPGMKTFNKPEITEERIEDIRRLIEENPGMGRTKLSVALCEMWNWRGVNGKVKDMSCRDLLRSLDDKGKITLPPPMARSWQAGQKPVIQNLLHDDTPITGVLGDVMPLCIETVTTKEGLTEFKSAINQFHYLGFDRFVGERMAYKV